VRLNLGDVRVRSAITALGEYVCFFETFVDDSDVQTKYSDLPCSVIVLAANQGKQFTRA